MLLQGKMMLNIPLVLHIYKYVWWWWRCFCIITNLVESSSSWFVLYIYHKKHNKDKTDRDVCWACESGSIELFSWSLHTQLHQTALGCRGLKMMHMSKWQRPLTGVEEAASWPNPQQPERLPCVYSVENDRFSRGRCRYVSLNLHEDAWHVQTKKQANDTERMLVCVHLAKSLDHFIVDDRPNHK